MQFFNQKEEVLDVILTKKGKELLAQGKFKPHSYKFFDDKITYEASNNEEQNATVPRIKATPYPKQGLLGDIYTKNSPSNKNINIVAPYGFSNKIDIPNELGQSDQFTSYAPAWNVQFLESSGTYASGYLSASFNGKTKFDEKIPQFNVNIVYKIALVKTYYDEETDKYYYSNEYKDKFNYVQLILQKDTDDFFAKFTEANSFLETQKQELTIEMFKYKNVNGPLQELKPINMNAEEEDSFSKYFTILFDDIAEESSKFNTKNIYEEESEDVC